MRICETIFFAKTTIAANVVGGAIAIGDIETAFFQNKKFSSMKSYLRGKNPSGKDGVKYTPTAMDDLFKCWGL